VSNGRCPHAKLEVVGSCLGNGRCPGVKLEVVGKVGE
jgi:hypothetical protein